MKISLDFDGVTGNTMKRWLEVYNIHYPSNKKYYNDLRRWAFSEDFGVSNEQFFDFLKLIWEDYTNLEPMESQLDKYTSDIRSKGHVVDIVTSVLPTHVKYVEKWLELNQISYDLLVHSDDKLKLDYDLYIDDRPALFEEIVSYNLRNEKKKKGIIYNQPWNQGAPDNWSFISRVNNWSEVVREVV